MLGLPAHHAPRHHCVAKPLPVFFRKELEIGERTPDELDRGTGENLARRGIRERDDSGWSDGEQPRGDRCDDVLVEHFQLCEVFPVRVELDRGLAQFLRDEGRQQRGRIEAGEIRRHVQVEPERRERRHREKSLLGNGDDPVVEKIAQAGVENHARRGCEQASPPVKEHRCRDDRNEVEEREGRVEAAGEVDEQRLDEEISRDLNRKIQIAARHRERDDDVEQGQRVRDRGDAVEIVDREELLGGELDDQDDDQQCRDRDDADRDEGTNLRENSIHRLAAIRHAPEVTGTSSTPERLREGDQPTWPISANIGMYIAMTMPPIATPRKAMSTGSRSFMSPATAVSTSSS